MSADEREHERGATAAETAAAATAAGERDTAADPEGPHRAPAVPDVLAARPRHTARWIAGSVLLVLVVVAIFAATRPTAQATRLPSPLVGHAAPAFSGTDFSGHTVSLAQYRGRYVYVNFFASWCPPCQEEEPSLVSFAFQQHRAGRSGAALVSVVYNDANATAETFMAQSGADWPTLPDPGATIANDYGVTSPPMTFLVDPSGRVVGVWEGPVKLSTLDDLLAAARQDDG